MEPDFILADDAAVRKKLMGDAITVLERELKHLNQRQDSLERERLRLLDATSDLFEELNSVRSQIKSLDKAKSILESA